jgi:hypothetical protein
MGGFFCRVRLCLGKGFWCGQSNEKRLKREFVNEA